MVRENEMENLSVEELIEHLQKMPQKATVVLCVGDEGDAYGFGDVVDNGDVVDLVLNEMI